MPGDIYPVLYEIAVDQHGYFTTAQARVAHVRPMTIVMMEKRGKIERVSRGVYRLVHFPLSPNALYMEATLWPVEPTGVLSHQSALVLHDLSDASPAKVHVTVPRRFRLRRKTPAYLVLHRADLPDDEVEFVDGIPVTTPERTIRDCHAAAIGPALVRQAIEDGRRSGRLSASAADRLVHELLPSPGHR